MGFSRMVRSSLRFGISGECNSSVNLTHFFLSIFFLAGDIFFLPIALAFLEGLPTFDPYVPFPYGIIYFLLVKRPLMYQVHCREQCLAGLLKRSSAESASFQADPHMFEVFWRSSRPLAFFVEHPVPVFREFLASTAEAVEVEAENLHPVAVH